MADRFFGIELGADAHTVAEDSTSGGEAIEVVVDLTDSPTRIQVLEGMEHLKNYITTCDWPPA
jgi:hypothetical protein